MPIPSHYTTPVKITAKERAYSQIQRWIIDGTLQQGEKLGDAELAEALGVSRTPVREALQLLEVQGLVEVHPGNYTKVKSMEKSDILKMYPTLAALHALAAETAATVVLAEQLEELQAINTQFAEAIACGQPYQAMELDEQFHNSIIEISENHYVSTFSSSLHIHIRRFKYLFLKQPVHATLSSVQEHTAIIEAMRQGDKQGAAAMMKQNLLRPMNELYGLITHNEE
jgi:DNA-binding GntR family transcriptional regulator